MSHCASALHHLVAGVANKQKLRVTVLLVQKVKKFSTSSNGQYLRWWPIFKYKWQVLNGVFSTKCLNPVWVIAVPEHWLPGWGF
jgi:hypothetical protein